MTGRLLDGRKLRISGDRAVLVEYGEGIDLEVNEKVRAMTELLRMRALSGIENVLPSYRSIAVIYDPLVTSPSEIQDHLLAMEADLSRTAIATPLTVEIPVCYGGEFGPDIEFVASTNGLSVEEVIAIHSAPLYPIYVIGFAPGFCYLGGLDPRIHAPRLETPRLLVPEGSVGIAESQTGVYPLASPGGWRLIGRTPLRLFAPERPSPFLYKAGDRIKFVPVTITRYEELFALDREGA